MEGYREFLDRVHRADVEQGKGMHREGVCAICEEARCTTRKSDFREGESSGERDSVRGAVP